MSFRFRRSIKIAPGLRLNFGKKSLSFSAGIRGAQLTLGTSGARTTTGLPGTGLSYSKKLGSFSRGTTSKKSNTTQLDQGKSAKITSADQLREYIELGVTINNPETGRRYTPAQLLNLLTRLEKEEDLARKLSAVEAEKLAYEKVLNISHNTLRLPDNNHWGNLLQRQPFQPEEFDIPEPRFDEVEREIRKQVFGDNRLPIFGWALIPLILIGGLTMYFYFLRSQMLTRVSLALMVCSAIAYIVEIYIRRKSLKRKLEALIGSRSREEFEVLKKEHESMKLEYFEKLRELEAEHEQAENDRIAKLERLTAGDVKVIEEKLEDVFSDIDVPVETEVSFEVQNSNCVHLDVDLPEIELYSDRNECSS